MMVLVNGKECEMKVILYGGAIGLKLTDGVEPSEGGTVLRIYVDAEPAITLAVQILKTVESAKRLKKARVKKVIE